MLSENGLKSSFRRLQPKNLSLSRCFNFYKNKCSRRPRASFISFFYNHSSQKQLFKTTDQGRYSQILFDVFNLEKLTSP